MACKRESKLGLPLLLLILVMMSKIVGGKLINRRFEKLGYNIFPIRINLSFLTHKYILLMVFPKLIKTNDKIGRVYRSSTPR